MGKDFRSVFSEVGGLSAAATGASLGEDYVTQVEEAVERASSMLKEVAERYRSNPEHSLKGFMAEAYHAGTFNIDAARQGIDGVKASLPQSTEPGSPDVVVRVPCDDPHLFQVKYYRSASDTAVALSHPAYHGMGKVGPAEQIDQIREAATERSVRFSLHRPEQASHLADTAERVSSRISVGGAASRELDSHEALAMARKARNDSFDPAEHGISVESNVDWADIVRQSGEAAVPAAVVSVAIRAAPHLYRALKTVIDSGEFPKEELEDALKEGGAGLAQGAIRGAVAAGLVGACKAGLLGESAKSIDPTGVGAAVAVVLSSVGDGIRLARGEISGAEFAARTGKKVVVGTVAVVGAHVGQTLIPIPVVGAVIGNILGSVIGTLGFEVGKVAIEKLENREGWEAQIALGEAIVRLAISTRIAADKLDYVVTIHTDEMVAMARCGERLLQQSRQFQQHYITNEVVRSSIDARLKQQQIRLASLKKRMSVE